MAAVSLFWDINMAAVMSCENTLLKKYVTCKFPAEDIQMNDCHDSQKLEGFIWENNCFKFFPLLIQGLKFSSVHNKKQLPSYIRYSLYTLNT